MADQSGSPSFQTLFESALQAYEEKTGVTLARHPLAHQLQSCHSTEEIITLLQGQVQAFEERRRNKIIKSIKATVSILTPLSAAAFLANDFGLVVRSEALMALFHFSDHLFVGTCKGNSGLSRYPTKSMCCSPVHTQISL
jgi:hypothetical protein